MKPRRHLFHGGPPRPQKSLPLALGLALVTAGASRTARADEQDPWFGQDKALHFAASSGLAAGGYGVGAVAGQPTWARFAIGGSVAMGAGIAKEVWDMQGHGDPSWRDVTWDVLGTAAGLGLAYLVDRLVSGKTTSGDATVRSQGSVGILAF
jgi:putative lipoprotein